jgi:uncharacterized protein YbcC (UPF0753/DUF2309 family)
VAALLNEPEVRSGLKLRGILVPEDTHFIPGVHRTTTDEVILLDTHSAPQSHASDVAQLQSWLVEAGKLTRLERSAALGIVARDRSNGAFLQRVFGRRSRDWSELRPEWGLARNAAFIAARRDRTRGVDLEGRAFLHEYDWRSDPDHSVLGLILSAPMVVASWINLQYFAATVDNATFGSGNKVLHNRVDTIGVVLGNGGDLRSGLPLQSVHDRDGHWFHEPLRLQVLVEAPTEHIDSALAAHPAVRNLVDNGWVRLFALNPEAPELARRFDGNWVGAFSN